jgi:hypothetical protein
LNKPDDIDETMTTVARMTTIINIQNEQQAECGNIHECKKELLHLYYKVMGRGERISNQLVTTTINNTLVLS